MTVPKHGDVAALLGQQVEVVLDTEPKQVVVRGQLLGFGDGGNFEILEDDGFVYHCWPLLEIIPRPEDTMPRLEGS
jgi:hypothetical protein